MSFLNNVPQILTGVLLIIAAGVILSTLNAQRQRAVARQLVRIQRRRSHK